jgi:anti-sigma regulatory factor (Ser/Thr protein kinase)
MAECLETWDVNDDDRQALVLVVGELASNAILHGRGSVELYVNRSATVLRIELADQGGGQPRIRPVEHSGPRAGGWGLRLVDQLVDMWGTTVRPGRTVVWVQHTIHPAR